MSTADLQQQIGQLDADAPAIAVLGLTKHFGEVEAVREVSFAVRPGEVFALLGPTGPASRRRSRCCAPWRGRPPAPP